MTSTASIARQKALLLLDKAKKVFQNTFISVENKRFHLKNLFRLHHLMLFYHFLLDFADVQLYVIKSDHFISHCET